MIEAAGITDVVWPVMNLKDELKRYPYHYHEHFADEPWKQGFVDLRGQLHVTEEDINPTGYTLSDLIGLRQERFGRSLESMWHWVENLVNEDHIIRSEN